VAIRHVPRASRRTPPQDPGPRPLECPHSLGGRGSRRGQGRRRVTPRWVPAVGDAARASGYAINSLLLAGRGVRALVEPYELVRRKNTQTLPICC
jgi:hypothetical protein